MALLLAVADAPEHEVRAQSSPAYSTRWLTTACCRTGGVICTPITAANRPSALPSNPSGWPTTPCVNRTATAPPTTEALRFQHILRKQVVAEPRREKRR